MSVAVREACDHAIRGQVAEGTVLRAGERVDLGANRVDQVDRSGRRVIEDVATDAQRAMLDDRTAPRPGIRPDRAAGLGRLIENAGTRPLRAGVHGALPVRIEDSPEPGVAVRAGHEPTCQRGDSQVAKLLGAAVSMERLQGAAALDHEDARGLKRLWWWPRR